MEEDYRLWLVGFDSRERQGQTSAISDSPSGSYPHLNRRTTQILLICTVVLPVNSLIFTVYHN